MKKETRSRKEIARSRIRGFLIFLVIVLLCVLFYDVYLFVKGWFLK